MFIKNKTKTYQSFMLRGKSFKLAPFGTATVTDDEYADGVMKLLLSRKVVEVIDDEAGIEQLNEEKAEAEAKVEESKIPVGESLEEAAKKEVATMVQCSAHNKNGNRCASRIKVDADEFDSDRPYFCGKHSGENPDDYEKIDGVFIKKADAE